MGKDVYDIGELPPVGEVPPRMHGMLVRPDGFGDPTDAIRDEVIDVPEIGPRDVLVATMAAGV
ncbi:MAG: crotonyl-CoA carboxylase/reductase, partial [Actinobacteria bacterium]